MLYVNSSPHMSSSKQIILRVDPNDPMFKNFSSSKHPKIAALNEMTTDLKIFWKKEKLHPSVTFHQKLKTLSETSSIMIVSGFCGNQIPTQNLESGWFWWNQNFMSEAFALGIIKPNAFGRTRSAMVRGFSPHCVSDSPSLAPDMNHVKYNTIFYKFMSN